jgi:TorA maturation chaperone TorD
MIACAESLLQPGDASASQSQSAASAQLHSAWQALREAAAGENLAPAIRQEYDEVFVGVGKAEVTPYLGHYLDGMPGDRFLVRLRDALAALGLARAAGATEPEDHISGLFDTMRHLILRGAGDGDEDGDSGSDEDAAMRQQKRFFEEFVRDAALKFCEAVQQSHKTAFYKRVSRIAESLLRLESEAFAMV